MDLNAMEALAEDLKQGSALQAFANFCRHLLWNNCLDFTPMVESNCSVEKLDASVDRSRDQEMAENVSHVGRSSGSSRLDPHASLCSYELAGVCADPFCPYQHLSTEDRPGGLAMLTQFQQLSLPDTRDISSHPSETAPWAERSKWIEQWIQQIPFLR